MNRRDFGRRAAAATATLAMLRLESFATVLSDVAFVDFHTHLGQIWGNRPALSAGSLIQWMDANGISMAVVHPLESPEAWDYPITTDFVLRETEPYRDRLIPAAVIDPRVIDLSAKERAVLLHRFVNAGARVFGEHKPGVAMASRENMELFATVAETDLPVLFHMDALRNMDEVGLPGLEEVLRAYPQSKFVGHGPGFWASISGDATETDFRSNPARKITRAGAVPRLMETYPNLYGDLGGASGANAIMRDQDFGRDFLIRFADRLLWSSDYLTPGQDIAQLSFFHELNLPQEVQVRIFRGNARRLIGLT